MKKFAETVIKNDGGFFAVHKNGKTTYEIQGLTSSLLIIFGGWVSPEDHQAEIGKIELQNLKYREEIARMQKSLCKKNKAIKELNGAVKKNKERLKECEALRIEANNEAAKEYALKCEVVEERAEFKREIEKLKSQLEKQQPEIPEFVAEYIERCKRSDCGLIWAVRPDRDANENSEKIYDWLYPNGVRLSDGTFPEPFEPDNLVRPDKENHIKFVRAWLDGYTVAKEKRFYLKNKLTGQRLIRLLEENGGGFLECVTSTDKERMQFTQSEIDSMAADSYEKIEVQE